MDFGCSDIYIYFFPFSLYVSVYVYASVCNFVCITLLLKFVLGYCLPFFVVVVFFLWFLGLVIIGGFVFWFGCSLLSLFLFFITF